MRRFILVFCLICLGLVGLSGAIFLANGGLRLPGASQPATGACTADAPCEIRILFAYTSQGAKVLQPSLDFEREAIASCAKTGRDPSLCVLDRVANEDVAALRQAFLTSGVTQLTDGRPNIVFAPPVVMDRAIDEGAAMRLDTPANYGSPSAFNKQLLGWLPEARSLRGKARKVNLVVVFTGMRGPEDACYADSLQNNGYILMPACLVRGYVAVPRIAFDHQLLFLHEVGHLFGAFHNDNGNPQPCSVAAASRRDPRGCAWEQCLARQCSTEQLAEAPDAFCTLVGQYNYNGGPTGERFCRAHRAGEQGLGWIREYSHPGKCRLRGYEAYDCGDASHDAVGVMRARAWSVSRARPLT
ncbi:hypothetical protein QO010_001965 [Caulobacter ginsengisoli]|uniref:Peptidase M43 pregnancy-associated plasma-A domain-containing protein n=1 Tax=Caulobacter ginsengisoli TaxID=400775 RepID=A0ABU0IQ92_9CAUL|nr:hypothetical protein [Caulobacter ginsengisoli]MDQ0464184.1 hypothetical protein [Caulobacter ginsengisoli]